jgi:hypothetical protein
MPPTSRNLKKTEELEAAIWVHPLLCHLRLLEKAASNHYVCGRLAGVITSKLSIEFNGILCESGLLEKTKYRNYKAEGKRRKYSGLSFHCLRHTTTSALKKHWNDLSYCRRHCGPRLWSNATKLHKDWCWDEATSTGQAAGLAWLIRKLNLSTHAQ